MESKFRTTFLVSAVLAVVTLSACSGSGILGASGDDAGAVLFESSTSRGPDPSRPPSRTRPSRRNRSSLDVSPGASVVFAGNSTGLYGGTGDQTACDAAKLARFLHENPSKARAWADVQGIGTDEIEACVATLTLALLLRDTRVTNRGYKSDGPLPRSRHSRPARPSSSTDSGCRGSGVPAATPW